MKHLGERKKLHMTGTTNVHAISTICLLKGYQPFFIRLPTLQLSDRILLPEVINIK